MNFAPPPQYNRKARRASSLTSPGPPPQQLVQQYMQSQPSMAVVPQLSCQSLLAPTQPPAQQLAFQLQPQLQPALLQQTPQPLVPQPPAPKYEQQLQYQQPTTTAAIPQFPHPPQLPQPIAPHQPQPLLPALLTPGLVPLPPSISSSPTLAGRSFTGVAAGGAARHERGSASISPYSRGGGMGRQPASAGAEGKTFNAKQINALISQSGVDDLMRLFQAHSAELNHIHLGNLWNKLAKQMRNAATAEQHRQAHGGVFTELMRLTVTQLPSCDAQALSNIAHGVANVDHAAAESKLLLDSLAGQALLTLGSFNSQDLANTVAAFATAKVEAPDLFDAVAVAIPPQLTTFKPQEISNTVWAFAVSGHSAPELFGAVAQAAPPRLHSLRAQDLADLVWSFAKLGAVCPELFAHVASEVVPRRLRELNARELASMAWAFATAGVSAPDFFDGIEKACCQKIRDFSSPELGNLVWAFGVMGVDAPELMLAVARAAPTALARNGNPVAVANLILGLGYEQRVIDEPGLFGDVALAAARRIAHLDAHDAAECFINILENGRSAAG